MSIIKKILFLCLLKIDTLACMTISPNDLNKVPNSNVRVWVLNVGQGNCVAVRRGDRSVLIDAGNSSQPRISETMPQTQIDRLRFIAERNQELERENVTRLQDILAGSKIHAIVVTHAHYDHYSFLLTPIWEGLVDSPILILGGNREVYSRPPKGESTESIEDSIRGNVRPSNVMYTESMADVGWLRSKLNSALGIEGCAEDEGFFPLLSDKPVESTDENDHSLVLSFSSRCMHGTQPKLNTLLFTGDATNKALEMIKKHPFNLDCLKKTNVAIVPHHGSEDASEWYLFLFKECCELLGCIVSADIKASEYEHPRSIINGERIAQKCNGIEFSFEYRRFMFSKDANRLYEVKTNSNAILGSAAVKLDRLEEEVGAFTEKLLSTITSISQTTKGKLPKRVMKCEVQRVNTSKGDVSLITPKLLQNVAHIPHIQFHFLSCGDSDEGSLDPVGTLTTFPIYSTGDTSLGYYELILNRCGLYLLHNPGSAKNEESVISIARKTWRPATTPEKGALVLTSHVETQHVASFDAIQNLRIPDCCFLTNGGYLGDIDVGEELYADQDGYPSIKTPIGKLKRLGFGYGITEFAITGMKPYTQFLKEKE